MSRVQTQLKIHELHGPRLPYKPREAEIRENEYAYLTADGIAVLDGEGILYWIDTIGTSDAGGVRVYDNNAASGKTLAGAYVTKAVDGVLKNWDPPKKYEHGIYVDLTNAIVEICYKPVARNLRCTVTVFFIPMTLNLRSRLTVRVSGATRALVSRLIARKMTSRNLVSKLVTRKMTSKNLVSRLVSRKMTGRDLPVRLIVAFATGTSNLVSKVEVRQNATKNLVSRVAVNYNAGTLNLVAQVTVRVVTGRPLTCHVYADRTE